MDKTPYFATIDDWCRLSGMGRTRTYDAIGRGYLKAVKLGNRTLVDVETGLAWMRNLPPAEVKPQHRAAA